MSNITDNIPNSQHSTEVQSNFSKDQNTSSNCQNTVIDVLPHSQESVDEIEESLMQLDLTPSEICNIEQDTNQNTEIQEHTKANSTEKTLTEEEYEVYKGSLIGFKASTHEEIFEAYKKHANALGFSVRKSTSRYTQGKNRVLVSKQYCCSKEGFRCKPKTVKSFTPTTNASKKKRKGKQVPVTRTGCKAHLRAKVNDEGMFEVDEHVIAHNHELTRRAWQHLHRSERQITEEKAAAIDTMLQSGLRATQSYNLMSYEAGGFDSVGHTAKDHLNYVYRLKMKEIEGGDAQNVIDSLYQKQVEDPNFFFRFKLGDEQKGNKLISIFWRDSQMLEDFSVFGDVVVFDTTFRTNKYNLICAPFVGINNHWQNVMFGCAFIADETASTFEWLLNTFKKSMGGAEPTSIFTDQDFAMAKAIDKVYPNVRHRLCIWHLLKNAVDRFGSLKKDKTFHKVFNKCLTGCVSEVEFEMCWAEMMKNYKLENNRWFNKLYESKNKWCTALSKDFFSAGILSSQRSESTNNAIGFRANRHTTLTEFFKIFKQTVQRWRRNESDADFQCSNSDPHTHLPMVGLIKHASEVYSQTLFRDFETEFKYVIASILTEVEEFGGLYMYEVWIENDETSKHFVSFNSHNTTVECTCKNYEEVGWLCYHCLRVLLQNSITRIPDKYICKRWTKQVKSEIWKRRDEQQTDTEVQKQKYIPWRANLARKSYNVILKSQEYQETRKVYEERLMDTMNEIEKIISEKKKEEEEALQAAAAAEKEAHTIETESPEIPTVQNPSKIITKGRKKRIKSHHEKQKQPNMKKTKAMIAKGDTREFGTITPIQKQTLF